MDAMSLASKWIHLLSVAGVVGGALLMRFVVLPSAGGDPSIKKRFGMLTGILWLLVFATGFYNLFKVWPVTTKAYHHILEAKVLLAVVMFVIAVLLGHPAAASAKMDQRRPSLITITLILGILVLGLSAHMNLSRISGAGLLSGLH